MDKKLVQSLTETTLQIAEAEHQISLAIAQQNEKLQSLREQEAELRDKIKEAMEKNAITKFENEVLRINYIAPQKRVGIDTTRLKAEHPEIAEEYSKVTNINSTIRIKIKERK